MTRPAMDDRGAGVVPAELGLLALGLALAGSSVRLFSDTRALRVLLVVAVLAWAAAAVMRRLPVRPFTGDMLLLLGGMVGAIMAVGRDSLWFGLPNTESLARLAEVVRADFSGFSDEVAPLASGEGHLLVVGGLIWVLAVFASSACIRLRSPVQGAVPHVVAILALGLLARDEGRTTAAVLLVAGVGLHCLGQAMWRTAAYRWVPDRRAVQVRRFVGGGALLATAGIAGILLAPLAPGSADPVLDLRRGGIGGGPRNVVSPFVEVGSNLGPRSDELLFEVTADQPSYWRLTALDEYDPEAGIWVLSNSYKRVEGPVADPPGPRRDLAVDVVGLGGFWVPSAPRLAETRSELELSWDADAGSLISRDGDLAQGDRVDQTAGAAGDDLAAEVAAASPPGGVEAVFLDTSGVPPTLAREAEVRAAGMTPYESALALQDWFRTDFTYDEAADFSDAEDPLQAFLNARRGFCQQFSTAFALAARSLGLPARVVAGFTPGDATATGADGTTFEVRGRHAHAWPEILLEGVGWVAFEPTPGRGDPDTTGITGVQGAQAAPDGGEGQVEVTTTTAPATTSPADAPPSTAPLEDGQQVQGGDVPDPEPLPEDGGPGRVVLFVVLGLLGAAVAAVLWWRRRSGPADQMPDARAAGAWGRAVAATSRAGVPASPSDTPSEYARRAVAELGVEEIRDLAAIEGRRRFSGRELDPSDAEAAEDSARRIVEELARP